MITRYQPKGIMCESCEGECLSLPKIKNVDQIVVVGCKKTSPSPNPEGEAKSRKCFST